MESVIDSKGYVKFYCLTESNEQSIKNGKKVARVKVYHKVPWNETCIAKKKKATGSEYYTFFVKSCCPNTNVTLSRITTEAAYDDLKAEGVKTCPAAGKVCM